MMKRIMIGLLFFLVVILQTVNAQETTLAESNSYHADDLDAQYYRPYRAIIEDNNKKLSTSSQTLSTDKD